MQKLLYNDEISKNVQSIEISGIRRFFNKASKYPNAVSLTLGQPDLNVPDKIKTAIIEAVRGNLMRYTSNAGLQELRFEISKYMKSFEIKYTPEEICITVGGSEGLMDVFTALINSGDKVLIPSPAYPAYESCVKLLGGEVINYELNDDFSINFEKITKKLDEEKPKVMVLSYPSNPTGAVLSSNDRDRLYDIVKIRDIIIVSDEIYSSLCYIDEYHSIAQIDELLDKTIVVSGFSKMFSMTGLRVGYVCARQHFMQAIMKVHQYNVSCAPSISQYGALEGLKTCMSDALFMKEEFKKRRDYVFKRLSKMGFEINCPEGAFYIFPSIKKYNISSEEFCIRLLEEAGVAVVPGSAFGVLGEGYFRISYACSIEKLDDALTRIEKWLKKNSETL
jgi:aminotransferase